MRFAAAPTADACVPAVPALL